MKKILFLFILISPFVLNAQEVWTKKLTAFSTLKLEGRMKVFLTYGEQFKVDANIHGEDAEKENLVFRYNKGKLEVHYKGGSFKDIDLVLTFYLPKAVNIEANRGVIVRCKPNYSLKANNLSITAFAGGKVAAHVQCKNLNAEINQGGSIRLSGNTSNLDCKILTGGTISSKKLNAKVVKAKVTMGGEIITKATDLLDAKVSSGGTISYLGTPKKINEKVTLGGTIQQL